MADANKVALKVIDKAIRAVDRKIPFASEKRRNKMLSYAAGDMAEAYQIGAEEAQVEFLARLHAIRRGLLPKPATWFDGGYLGNGRCSFMWARNGEGACCCLPHGHEGTHLTDSQANPGGGK
jgi:hypothetical protein